MKLLSGLLALCLCAGTAFADEVKCTQSNALKVVHADARIQKFCSASINGLSNGCDYQIRPATENEVKSQHEIRWLAIVSLVHSFDENHQPRFMPEGASIIRLDNKCKILEVLGPSAVPLQ